MSFKEANQTDIENMRDELSDFNYLSKQFIDDIDYQNKRWFKYECQVTKSNKFPTNVDLRIHNKEGFNTALVANRSFIRFKFRTLKGNDLADDDSYFDDAAAVNASSSSLCDFSTFFENLEVLIGTQPLFTRQRNRRNIKFIQRALRYSKDYENISKSWGGINHTSRFADLTNIVNLNASYRRGAILPHTKADLPGVSNVAGAYEKATLDAYLNSIRTYMNSAEIHTFLTYGPQNGTTAATNPIYDNDNVLAIKANQSLVNVAVANHVTHTANMNYNEGYYLGQKLFHKSCATVGNKQKYCIVDVPISEIIDICADHPIPLTGVEIRLLADIIPDRLKYFNNTDNATIYHMMFDSIEWHCQFVDPSPKISTKVLKFIEEGAEFSIQYNQWHAIDRTQVNGSTSLDITYPIQNNRLKYLFLYFEKMNLQYKDNKMSTYHDNANPYTTIEWKTAQVYINGEVFPKNSLYNMSTRNNDLAYSFQEYLNISQKIDSYDSGTCMDYDSFFNHFSVLCFDLSDASESLFLSNNNELSVNLTFSADFPNNSVFHMVYCAERKVMLEMSKGEFNVINN